MGAAGVWGQMEERDRAGSGVPRIKVLEMRDLGRRVTAEDGVLWGKEVLGNENPQNGGHPLGNRVPGIGSTHGGEG